MSSNWFLYGPFSFEASAVAGSARGALAHLVEQYQTQDRWSRLHVPSSQPELPGRAEGRKAGLYLILRTEEEIGPYQPRRKQRYEPLQQQPRLAGFWVVFSHTYLGEGVVGPPDKEPPYVQGILEACTEEVWWNNLSVYPHSPEEGTWKPCLFFEWPPELSFRSELAPPGLPLSADEIANPEAEETRLGDWLEQVDEEVKREERRQAERAAQESPWTKLPQHRSLMMLTQGFLQKKRVTHEGSFRMVHPEWLGTGNETERIGFDVWMDRVFAETAPERTDRELHYRGQPLELLGGKIGFPISGWLTRNLTVWPTSPVEIRKGRLSPRDIGSKLVAQLKQATAVTSLVLLLLVGLSWVVYILTKPPLVAVEEPVPPPPEPAMSVCSADHAKFMDEFRCQIESFVYGPGTDQPVCGDRGSKELVRSTAFDLQAEYCGLRDRRDDGWVWPRDAQSPSSTYNFGYVAAAKACFNVLGHPYNYKLPTDFSSTTQTDLPNPDYFLNHPDLSIRGLSVLVQQLDSACEAYRERMEFQLEGAIFATHIGTRPSRAAFDDQSEGGKLRLKLSGLATLGVKADLRQCFNTGMGDGPYAAKRFGELCDFASQTDPNTGKNVRNDIFDERKVWKELYSAGKAKSVQDVTGELNELTAAVERYDFARFGNPLLPNRGNRSMSLWQCHEYLQPEPSGRLETQFVSTKWDLSVPIPGTYRIEGAGVKTQLSLDAALQAFADGENSAASRAGACWKVTSRRLSKYTPVHPLLAELDPGGWPSVEQQLCGQVCGANYRMAISPSGDNWVTPGRDLQLCVTNQSPIQQSVGRHAKRMASIDPGRDDAYDQYADAVDALIRSTDPTLKNTTFSPFVGRGFDRLRVPWNQRPERQLEQLARSYTNAVLRRDARACDDIQLNDVIYLPNLSEDASGTVDELCRENFNTLNTENRSLCRRYFELEPRYDQLREECRLAVELDVIAEDKMSRNDLEKYLEARVLTSEGWVAPDTDQICAFNLIAQGYLHDAEDSFLLGGLAPPAWAGQTATGSRIAGGGLGAKESVGVAYQAATSLSRFGRTRSRNTCSYAASQCFAEMFMHVSGDGNSKPFDWKEEWTRLLQQDIYNTDKRAANRLRERSPWCALIQPYVNLEPGDIDYPCAIGVDEARKSTGRTIDYLAEEIGSEG
ncbi:MAG: hypothetical protein AAFV53_22600 [Myxococcota bacterium]